MNNFLFDKKTYPIHPNQDVTLEEIIKNTNNNCTIGAEIGCWTGRFTSVLSKFVREKIYVIDWFKGSEHTSLKKTSEEEDIREVFIDNMKTLDLLDKIELLTMTSYEASKLINNVSLDFIFIDSDHRYEYIKQDLDIWYPKIKIGGLLIGHDCEKYYKDLSNEEKKMIDEGILLGVPWIEIGHLGVIKAVYEKFNSNYTITNQMWWSIKC